MHGVKQEAILRRLRRAQNTALRESLKAALAGKCLLACIEAPETSPPSIRRRPSAAACGSRNMWHAQHSDVGPRKRAAARERRHVPHRRRRTIAWAAGLLALVEEAAGHGRRAGGEGRR